MPRLPDGSRGAGRMGHELIFSLRRDYGRAGAAPTACRDHVLSVGPCGEGIRVTVAAGRHPWSRDIASAGSRPLAGTVATASSSSRTTARSAVPLKGRNFNGRVCTEHGLSRFGGRSPRATPNGDGELREEGKRQKLKGKRKNRAGSTFGMPQLREVTRAFLPRTRSEPLKARGRNARVTKQAHPIPRN